VSRPRLGSRPAADPATAAATAAERSRRAFARRQRARRWLAWRPLALVAAVLLGVGGLLWLVLASPVLDLEEVRVEGAGQLTADEVLAAAAVPERPLARLDLEAVEERVEGLAAVREAEVSRSWPDAVVVRVEEREALAVVAVSGAWRALDGEGVLFRTFERAPAGLPRIVTPAGLRSDAVTEGARVVASLPVALRPRLDRIEVRTVDDIALVLDDGRRVVWGSADESDAKAQVADALLSAVRAQVYDVSVPGQPTTR